MGFFSSDLILKTNSYFVCSSACFLSAGFLPVYFIIFGYSWNSTRVFTIIPMTRSLITWVFVGWLSLIFIVSRFQSILKFNFLYDSTILRMKLGVKGLINVPLLHCSNNYWMVRHCHSAIVWLGLLWGFSENFLFSLLFSFWGFFPSRIFLLKAFWLLWFLGNFLLPSLFSSLRFFFIFYLHAWLDPCGPAPFFFDFRPILSDVSPSDFDFYLECFGHWFHNCMAINLFLMHDCDSSFFWCFRRRVFRS